MERGEAIGRHRGPTHASPVVVLGLLATAIAVFGLLVLAAGGGEASSAIMALPVLVLLALPAFTRQAHREQDRIVLWVLIAALSLKLLASFANYYVSFDVYGGVADAGGYHRSGVELAAGFRAGDFDVNLDPLIGTNFVRLVVGIVYTLFGSSVLVGFLAFAWLGFWGLFLFYRAFVEGVPEGRVRSYRSLVFFLPSLLYWPSTIGKEALMLFALGIAAFGAARIMTGRTWQGLLVASGGLWLATMVRPHVAGLMGLALVAGFLLRPSRRDLGAVAPLAKGIALAGTVVLAVLLLDQADRFLRQNTSVKSGSVADLLEETAERTSIGGSRFGPSVIDSPLMAPVAAANVLFRPHLLEVTSPQTLAAALETTFLLGLSIIRWRSWFASLRSVRRQPYVAFALGFVVLFIVAFSAIGNLGLLARERVQVLPLLLVPLAIPPPKRSHATGRAR